MPNRRHACFAPFPLRWAGALVLALALTTCTDNPSGPAGNRRAALALQPTFAPGLSLAAFGISIDSLRVIAIRPASDTLADQTVPFPADSSSLTLNVSVNLLQAVETLTVVLEFRGSGVVLFSGSQQVEVQSGAPGTNAPDTIPVSYAGPGAAVDSLEVGPADSVVSFNDSLRFRVAAFQAGVPVTQFYVSWTTSDTTVARANAIGLIRAPIVRASLYVIARTPSGAVDSTPLTFIPVPTLLTVAGGNAQSVPVSTGLPLPLRVRVTAGDGLGVKGVVVQFAAVTGGGSVAAASVVTDTGGYAQTAATVGSAFGAQTFQASVAGLPAVTFTATATSGAISAAQSVVTVSAVTVASGTGATLTLQGKDAAGNNVTTGGASVVFTRSGGSSTGTIGATTDNGNGTYTAAFTGVLAGTPTTIGATINGNPVTTAPPTIAVTAGAISATTSTVTVGSGTIASGAATTLTLQAKDAAGNALAAGGATVVFTASGGTSTGTIGATTDNGNGTYSATFTGVLAGTPTTIGATINGSPVTSTLPTVGVTPGLASPGQSVITVATGTIASGLGTTLTLQAKDAAGNLLTTGGATVVFTFSGGTSTGTIGPTTDNANGTYTAPFTGLVAGTPTTIGATINGSPVTTSPPTIGVTPGAISAGQSVITVGAGTLASGLGTTLTLQAKDAAGNLVTSGGATVAFTFSGGTSTGTIGATTDNGNGTYTATFTGVLAGTPTTIGATINASAVTSTLPTITVTPGAISAALSVITVSSATVASGAATTVTLQGKDAAGNNLTAGGATVVFSATGGTSTGAFGAVSDNGNGTYTATFTGAVAGSPTTIGATIGGSPVTSALPTVTVVPGNAVTAQSLITVSSGTVASGGAVTLTLQARDSAGNNLTSGGLTVVFSRSGGTSTGSIAPSPATDNGNGTYTATFTGVLAGTPTTIGATINGSPVTSTLPTITVTPGAISTATSTVATSASTVASGAAATLTLQAKDAAGNNLTSGGAAVVFTASGGTSTGSISAATDNGNGTYTATFTGAVAGTATTIGATINGSPVTSSLPAITVTAGTTATVTVTPATATLVALGDSVPLSAAAFDASGNPVPGETFTWATSNAGFATVSGTGIVFATGNGTATITATSSNSKTGTASVTVAQTVVLVQVLPGLDTLHALGNSRAFAAVAKDANDSVVPGQTFAWTASDTLVATVNAAGIATAVGNGIDTITATTASVSGTAVLVVQQVVASVTVTPSTASLLSAGQTQQFTAAAADSNAAPVTGQTFVWGSTNPSVATVDATGLATAVAVGVDTITATTAGVTGTAVLTILTTTHAADITTDETWTAAASPHIVTGYVRVRNGATLTIADSAVVKFDGGAGLQVGDTALGESGALVMQGTPGSILLTANTGAPTPGFWKGVEVQKSLAVPAWKNVDIEWAGGARPNPFNEACVLIVNGQGAPLELDSLKIRQCIHAAIHHFGGQLHVHRSEMDSVTGSGIHADFTAQLELDSTVIRGSGQEGLFLGSPFVQLGASSGNQFRGNLVMGIHLHAEQLPGLLQQDSITGNGSDAIEVETGRPDPAAATVTFFHQPTPSPQAYHVVKGTGNGLLDIGRVGGQELVLDSGLTIKFDPGTGLVIGDSAGTRSGTIRSLGTGAGDAPLLTGSPLPASWIGVELGRLSATDTIRNLRIENAGDSLPGRTVHRAGLWVRSPVVVPLVLDGVVFFGNGSGGASSNSAAFAMTTPGGGVEVRNGNFTSNLGYGLVVPDSGFRVTGNLFNLNTVAIAAFAQGGVQLTAADSIAGNTIANNQYAVALTAAALRAFYDTVLPANATDTLLLEGSFLTADARLPRVPGFVWHAAGSIAIDSNATFTIAPGNTVTFDTLAFLQGGGGLPAFVNGFPTGAAAITIGGLQGGALAAPGTAAEPILFTSSVPGRGWGGIQWAFPQGAGNVTNNVFNYVTVEGAGFFVPCTFDCLPTPFSALRFTDSTDVNLSFDHLIVRGGGAFGVDFERTGTGTLLVSNSQLYNNVGAVSAHSGHGNQLTIAGSDLYNYRGTVIDGTYAGLDSVNADDNWWGDVAGPNPGFTFADSLGRAGFAGTAVRAATFATVPFFPVGGPARLIAARDTFLVSDTVLSVIGQSDSLRVRVLDAFGRGVPGIPVSWVTTSGSVTPGSGSSDIGGRVSTEWLTATVAGPQSATASGVGAPVVFPLDLLPGNTIPTTVDWEMLPAGTVADSVHPNVAPGIDTVFYSSSNRSSAFVTHARDTYGNVTQPSFGPIFDQGPCAGFVCRFPAADSVKGDTVFFRPPVIGDYVISGLYEGGAGGSDQIVLRVSPVAAGVRIDRDIFTPEIQDTGSFAFNSLCRVGAPVNAYCGRQFQAYVVDSGGAPFGNPAARFAWQSPGGDTTITIDSTQFAPVGDLASASAHADGPTYLVVFDTSANNYGRDSMPVQVQQRAANLLVAPSADTLVIGDSTVFTAAVTDQGGDTIPAFPVHWRADSLYPGLTILDTTVANQVKVRLDSAPFGEAHVTAVTCCSTNPPPFDSLFGLGVVVNPVQIAVGVGTSPGDVSVNPVTHKAYVGLGTDSVAVIDVDGDSLLTRIPVPLPTYWTAVNTTTNRVYVGSNSAGTGYVIDGGVDAVVDSFSVGAAFFVGQMAVDEPRNRLYVPMEICVGTPVCSNVRFLGVLDGATLALIDTVRIVHQGVGAGYNPTLDRIYVATFAGSADTVKVIDAATLQVVDSIGVGAGAYAVTVNPATGKVYVTNSSDHTVSVIDGATDAVLATVSLGFSSPNDIAVDTVANLVYVAVSDNAFQFVIDGATDVVVSGLLLDDYATGVAAMPGRGPVLFTQFNRNAVKILRF